jgi:transglutaminase-like putative cysteine protease
MRIAATHSTIYRYAQPVTLEPHTFRLRPRDDAAQRVVSHRLSTTPEPAGQSAFSDQDGNSVVQAWFAGEVRELAVESAFVVETLRVNPFDFLLPPAEELELPLRLPEGLRNAVAPYLVTGGKAKEFAAPIAEASGRQLMPFLDRLTAALFQGFRHIVRRDGGPRAAARTLAEGEGSCRDLAVLFTEACRAQGIPARFVSGYETAAAFGEHAYMHAWAEVFVPNGGWRGYDPSRGLAVSTSHVAVAAAADPALAAPIIGTYRGSASSTMEFQIQMQANG